MTRQPVIARRAEQLLGAAVVSTAPVAGDELVTTTKLRLSDGSTAVIKTLTPAPEGFFEAQARGLRWLAATTADGGVSVPEVLAVEPDCLVLRWIERGRPSADGAAALGRSLAATHAGGSLGAPVAYGAEHDGFVGPLPLPNRTTDTWAEFYAVRRVLPYLKLAHDRGNIEHDDARAVEALIGRLTTLLPEEPAARLHGDLWNGTVVWAGDGHAWLVDPAAYAGHREMDLATMSLFGLPDLQRVLDAYVEASPLVDGWEERLALHQVFPLLVRACLSGGSYGARAADAARAYL